MTIPTIQVERPPLHLIKEPTNGNAFSIIAKANAAARKAGWTQAQIDAYQQEAMSGDYNHVLRTTMQYFDVD